MKKFISSIIAVVLCFTGITQAQIEDGTLIFLENSKWIVEQYTDSPTCHVAVIMNENGVPYVYQAEPPKVLKISLEDYYNQLAGLNEERKNIIKIFVLTPKKAFSKSDVLKMKEFAEGDVGRRYSIKGVVKDQPSDGTHCSQLASNILNQSKRFNLDKPYSISPVELRKLVDSEYEEEEIFVKITKPVIEKTWYQKTWDWCGRSCDLCGWSCKETWMWW